MRANDEVTAEYILEIETDNDHLRVENQELEKENEAFRAHIFRMQSDRECVD